MTPLRAAVPRFIALLAIFSFAPLSANAAPSRVGLLPLEQIGPSDPAYDELQTTLRRSLGGLVIGTVVDLPAPHGCALSDSHCAARAGASAEVDVVVCGSIERFSDGYAVRLKTVDVKTVEEHEVKRLVQGGASELLGVTELASCQLLTSEKCEGTIHVRGSARAHLVLDGHDVGSLPFEQKVGVGRHMVHASVDGRSTEDQLALVSFGQETALRLSEKGSTPVLEKDEGGAAGAYSAAPHFMATPPPAEAPPPPVPAPNPLTDLPPIPEPVMYATPVAPAPPPAVSVTVQPVAPTPAPAPAVAAPPPALVINLGAAPEAAAPAPVLAAPAPAAVVAPPPVAPVAPAPVTYVAPPPAVVAPPPVTTAPAPGVPLPSATTELVPTPGVAPPPPATVPAAAPPSSTVIVGTPPSRSSGFRTGFIISATATGAFLIAAIAAGADSQSLANDLNSKKARNDLTSADLSERNSAVSAATASNVFWGLTGAAAITAGALLLLNPHILFGAGGDEPQAVAVDVGPGAVGVAGHF
jgi:hypothetical protein